MTNNSSTTLTTPRRLLPVWLSTSWGIFGLVSIVYGLLFAVWTFLHWGGEQNVVLISDLATLPIDLLAAIVAWRVFVDAKFDPRIRKAWLILGLAMFSYFIGDVIWSYLENVLHVEPFPAISDAFYLGFYPLVLWGLSILPTTPLSRRERLTFWLDLLTTVVVATMAIAYFIVIPSARANPSNPLTQFVLVAYPLGDLIIFAGLEAILLRRPEQDSRSALSFFFVGMILFLNADVAFDYTGLAGTFASGGLIDAGWLGAHVLFIIAALRQGYRSTTTLEDSLLSRILDGLTQVLPYIAVGMSYILAADAVLIDFGPTALWLLAGAGLSTILFIVRQFRQNRVQIRLTAFMLVTIIPLLIGAAAFISSRAGGIIEDQANADLQESDESVTTHVSTWLELHTRTVKEIALLPDIISMDLEQQRPVLLAVAATHPNLFLVHITDLNGLNVARSDDSELKDYHDRAWFLGAKSGALTYEVLISRTIKKPAINIAVPIRNSYGQIIGTASVVSELNELSKELVSKEESGSYTYIVDANNKVVAHPDATLTSGDELVDFSTYPPVAALRSGQTGLVSFTDENGEHWRAYVRSLDNGWGIIAQQPEAELLAAVRRFQRVAVGLITIVAALMLLLAWFMIRRAFQPIALLTDAATVVAAGELGHLVEVKSQDDLGMLASAFNSMTTQMRELIGSLEQRVADRTKALAASAEVSRRLSTATHPRQLAVEVVEQVQSAFHYYHAHIYFLDETSGDLVMVGGTGEAGATMLARGHKIAKGRGLVGRAAETNIPVLVADVSLADDWLPNPLLPNTKCEAAIPISSGKQVLGVLDVQQNVVNGLSEMDVELLQSIAAQVAISLQNLRTFEDARTKAELESLVNTIGQKIQKTATVEDTLQTAIREIGLALGATRVRANVAIDKQNSNTASRN
jgi:putative methionine-R-sulfoxide reductase with GAF domain